MVAITNSAVALTPSQPQETTQSLFDYVASQTKAGAPASSLHELGVKVMHNLDGYVNRATDFSYQAKSRSPVISGGSVTVDSGQVSAQVKPGSVSDGDTFADRHLDKVVQSLSLMFDYSIETQMVVRGATQVSGAANTLVRGQ